MDDLERVNGTKDMCQIQNPNVVKTDLRIGSSVEPKTFYLVNLQMCYETQVMWQIHNAGISAILLGFEDKVK